MECQTNILNKQFHAVFSGQFVFSDHPKFKAVLAATENADISAISIDVAGVDFIDSAGLGMLLLLRDLCMKHKKSLILKHPKGQVKKVFDISKFEHLFTIEG